MKKRSIIALAIVMNLALTTTAFAETVSGIHFINNTDKVSDYKLSNSEITSLTKDVHTGTQYQEIFDTNNGRETTNLSSEDAWLINHNIITRTNSIKEENGKVTLTNGQLNQGYENTANFLMGLYKAEYGVIPSRPVVLDTPSYRYINGQEVNVIKTDQYTPKGYTGKATEFSYPTGDRTVFVSPNVQELYISKLLQMGIVKTSSIKDQQFLQQYYKNGTQENGQTYYAQWSNQLPAYTPNTGEAVNQYGDAGGSPLGACWNIQGYSPNSNMPMKDFSANRVAPQFFVNSDITTQQALQYIADILRTKEKDMTQHEAEMVAYKYGTVYLTKIPKDMQKTVTYLIAMGIVNFRNPQEFGYFFGKLPASYARTLLYRVANKAGRLDFSKITLTDQQSAIMKAGYVENPITIRTQMPAGSVETESVQQLNGTAEQQSVFSLAHYLGLTPQVRQVKYGAGTNTYIVTKKFFDPNDVTLDGVQLTHISTQQFQSMGITVKYSGNGQMVLAFKQNAPTGGDAIAAIDSRISALDFGNNAETVNTITSISNGDANNPTETSYISQTELQDTFTNIQVLNDKTLKNTQTGVQAIFLTDHHVALVGNNIVRTPGAMVILINNKVYYNFNLVVQIMTNATVSKLIPNTVLAPAQDVLFKTQMTDVRGGGSNSVIQQVPTFNLKQDSAFPTAPDQKMYNANMLTRGVSTLMRTFNVPVSGTNVLAKVIVNWSYAMPPSYTELNKNLAALNSSNPTIKGATQFFFTPPSQNGGSKDAQNWWTNNIELSNALANFMYGTSEVQYVKTGYLAPSITVLLETTNTNQQVADASVDSLFSNLVLPQGYVQQFLGGDPGKWTTLFNGTSGVNKLRHFNVLIGSKSGNQWLFNNTWLMTQFGRVYRSIASDPRLQWSNGSIYVNDRTAGNSLNAVKTYVTYNYKGYNYKFYVAEETSGGYYKLVSTTPITGHSGIVNGEPSVVNGQGQDMLTAAIDNLNNMFGKDYTIPGDNGNDKSIVQGLPASMLNTTSIFLGRNSYQKVNLVNNYVHTSDVGKNPNAQVTAYPIVYLKRTVFSIQNGKIIAGAPNPYVMAGNIYFSGLNNSLIDSLLLANNKAVPLSKLPVGAKVLIQDTEYTVDDNHRLISQVINNNSLASSLASCSLTQSAQSKEVQKYFTGYTISAGARVYPFTNYLTYAGLGQVTSNDTGSNTICLNGGQPYYVNGNNVQPFKGQYVSSAIISIATNDDIKYQLVNQADNQYDIVTATDQYCPGFINNVSFFAEKLGLTTQNDIILGLQKLDFHPIASFNKIKAQFHSTYEKLCMGDIKTWFAVTFGAIAFALFSCSWIGFGFLKGNLAISTLYAIRDMTGGSRFRGVDLIRIISLGHYGLDSEPVLYRQVISGFIYISIGAFCLICLGGL